jgi:hypothetical protein
MILTVTYETDKRTILNRYYGADLELLFDLARNCKEYRDSHTVTFDIDEVSDYGDKFIEC